MPAEEGKAGAAPAKPEEKKAETTPEPKKEEAKVPDKYELKLPEKTRLKADVLERTTATARELGLTESPKAQKLVDLLSKEADAAIEAHLALHAPGGEAWKETVNGWETAARADKAFGETPEQFTANVEKAKTLFQKYGTPAFNEFLNNSGFGSHPEVLRFAMALVKASAEGKLVIPKAQDGGKKDPAEQLYGGTAEKTT